jgi:hypothetical protein
MLCNALVQALRSNKRIDGLYLYINTSSAEVLAARQKQRLCEDASTLTKRVTWAKQQMAKSSAPGLFDAVIPNTSLSEVRAATATQDNTLGNALHCDTPTCITACHTCCGGCRLWSPCCLACCLILIRGCTASAAGVAAATGICCAERSHQHAEPHHTQQAARAACLCAGLLRPHTTQQVSGALENHLHCFAVQQPLLCLQW